MEPLSNALVKNLSGGELQRVAITICLGTPASVYLLDEPSAGLDCEQRVIAAKAHAPRLPCQDHSRALVTARRRRLTPAL